MRRRGAGRLDRPPLSFPAGPGGLPVAAPDDYTETFEPPQVDYQTNRDGETELTYVEYSTDLDLNDTTIETTYIFFIKTGGELRAEMDNHTTGLFPIATWERLLKEAGFEVDRVEYPVSKDGRGCYYAGNWSRNVSDLGPRQQVRYAPCSRWMAGGLETLSYESNQAR